MNAVHVLLVIAWLAILMIVHEGGHHLVARAFGMRVLRFSIGFGPALWRHQPKGSDTVYQVALIPFLAYVQIDGMNPFEEVDPDDKGSYANATLSARIATVFAGPLANYLFASVLFFSSLMLGGKQVPSMEVNVMEGKAAAAAGMASGDRIVRVNGKDIGEFAQLPDVIASADGKPLAIDVQRGNQRLQLSVTPQVDAESKRSLIGVESRPKFAAVAFREAAVESVVLPALVVKMLVVSLTRIATLQEKPELAGPIGIVKQGAKTADLGFHQLLYFMGILSAYLGGFNLLPIPALDGGRLLFLAYEAVARRKPNAKIEAQIHMVGLLMFLALMIVVSVFDIRK